MGGTVTAVDRQWRKLLGRETEKEKITKQSQSVCGCWKANAISLNSGLSFKALAGFSPERTMRAN